MRALTTLAIGIAALAPRNAGADEDVPPQAPPPPDQLAARIEALEQQQQQLEDEQQRMAAELRRNASTRETVKSLVPLRRFLTVFVDVGAFAVAGDGSGIRSDLDHLYYPKYANRVPAQWVFMGDPLSTAINSLGEPADESDSRELQNDTLKSHGHPSLILNSLGLSIAKAVNDDVAITALAELLPRPGSDRLDVELAHVDYRPSADVDLVLSAGKVDSVLGVEYRSQDAPRRLNVTPSLICRYTCGRPVGVQARLVRGPLSAALSVTNGDSFDNRFEPELVLHANALPTTAGHVQWKLPIGQGLELGLSGAIGPQTNQSDDSVLQWHVGLDARLYDLDGIDVVAEYVQGQQQGKSMSTTPCDVAPCLTYKGAYLLADRRMNPWLVPYVRVDWRDAVHENGVQFVYESHVLRATFGLHFEMTSRILAKIEYTFNHELGNIPQFPDDILTSSVVVATD